MVDDIPNSGGSDRNKHKKHKKDKKEQEPQTLQQLQTTPAFAPYDLLKEIGFDISPTTSSSSRSSCSPTSITVMDEKKYDLNICLFHLCNLELFQAINVLSPMSVDCSRTETSKIVTWVYSTRKFVMSTKNSKDWSCVNVTIRPLSK